MSPAEMLCSGLALPLPESPPIPVPSGTRCPLTGAVLTEGYPTHAIIPDTTGEWLDLLRGDTHGHLSAEAASCIRADWNLGSRAVFDVGQGGNRGRFDALYPLLARPKPGAGGGGEQPPDAGAMSSKKLKNFSRDHGLPRPCWSELIHTLPQRRGQPCLLIVAADPKKRVWHRARVGVVGERTPFLVFDSSRHLLHVVQTDIDALVADLTFIEAVYSAGFTKRGLAGGLLSETKVCAAVGMARAVAWERALERLRSCAHFPLAVLIAQRTEAIPLSRPTDAPAPDPPLGGLFHG